MNLPAYSCTRRQRPGSPCTPYPTLVSPSLVYLSGHSGMVWGSEANSVEKRVDTCIFVHINIVSFGFSRQNQCILKLLSILYTTFHGFEQHYRWISWWLHYVLLEQRSVIFDPYLLNTSCNLGELSYIYTQNKPSLYIILTIWPSLSSIQLKVLLIRSYFSRTNQLTINYSTIIILLNNTCISVVSRFIHWECTVFIHSRTQSMGSYRS